MQYKSIRLKAKIIFEWEYNVEPQFYFNDGKEHTIQEYINEDKRSFNDDIFLALDGCKNEPTIEIIEVK